MAKKSPRQTIARRPNWDNTQRLKILKKTAPKTLQINFNIARFAALFTPTFLNLSLSLTHTLKTLC